MNRGQRGFGNDGGFGSTIGGHANPQNTTERSASEGWGFTSPDFTSDTVPGNKSRFEHFDRGDSTTHDNPEQREVKESGAFAYQEFTGGVAHGNRSRFGDFDRGDCTAHDNPKPREMKEWGCASPELTNAAVHHNKFQFGDFGRAISDRGDPTPRLSDITSNQEATNSFPDSTETKDPFSPSAIKQVVMEHIKKGEEKDDSSSSDSSTDSSASEPATPTLDNILNNNTVFMEGDGSTHEIHVTTTVSDCVDPRNTTANSTFTCYKSPEPREMRESAVFSFPEFTNAAVRGNKFRFGDFDSTFSDRGDSTTHGNPEPRDLKESAAFASQEFTGDTAHGNRSRFGDFDRGGSTTHDNLEPHEMKEPVAFSTPEFPSDAVHRNEFRFGIFDRTTSDRGDPTPRPSDTTSDQQYVTENLEPANTLPNSTETKNAFSPSSMKQAVMEHMKKSEEKEQSSSSDSSVDSLDAPMPSLDDNRAIIASDFVEGDRSGQEIPETVAESAKSDDLTPPETAALPPSQTSDSTLSEPDIASFELDTNYTVNRTVNVTVANEIARAVFDRDANQQMECYFVVLKDSVIVWTYMHSDARKQLSHLEVSLSVEMASMGDSSTSLSVKPARVDGTAGWTVLLPIDDGFTRESGSISLSLNFSFDVNQNVTQDVIESLFVTDSVVKDVTLILEERIAVYAFSTAGGQLELTTLDKAITVGKQLLSTHSKYFRRRFLDDPTMKENRVIGVNETGLLAVLLLPYLHELTITDANVVSLLKLANRFEMACLNTRCVAFLLHKMPVCPQSSMDAMKRLSIVDRYGMKEDQKEAIRMMKGETARYLFSDAYNMMSDAVKISMLEEFAKCSMGLVEM